MTESKLQEIRSKTSTISKAKHKVRKRKHSHEKEHFGSTEYQKKKYMRWLAREAARLAGEQSLSMESVKAEVATSCKANTVDNTGQKPKEKPTGEKLVRIRKKKSVKKVPPKEQETVEGNNNNAGKRERSYVVLQRKMGDDYVKYKLQPAESVSNIGPNRNTMSDRGRVIGIPDFDSGVISKNKYLQLMSKANTAKRLHKTFCLLGDYPKAIREALLDKGWIERFCNENEKGYFNRLLQKPPDMDCKIMSHILGNHPIKFIWTYNHVNWQCVGPGVIVNRIPNNCHYFAKNSLAAALKELLPFYYNKGEVNVRIPRTYEIYDAGDMKHFSAQFRVSACVALLRRFADDMKKDRDTIISPDGSVPLDMLDFALKRTVEFIRFLEHADLDEWYFSIVREDDWALFLLRFYDIAHYGSKFKENNSSFNITKLIDSCSKMSSLLQKHCPDMEWEGYRNMWIVKPANMSCGRGVRIYKTLQDIQKHCKPNVKYVIQKYIEKPLLIYKTKFDVRQWFLITNVNPLIIWMYNKCYLRFCSQEFSLVNTHESVHLSNNSVQWKYKNGKRSSSLPSDNMWDSDTFQSYLSQQGEHDKWFAIQNKMKHAINGACLVSQEHMGHRANSFNLYGADFMITPDFQVYLIEINSHPSMKHSTSVTTRMCKGVLEDTLKVVLDRRVDPGAPTGEFFLSYRQKVLPHSPAGSISNIVIQARRARIYRQSLWKSTSLPGPKGKKMMKKKNPPLIMPRNDRSKTGPITYEELATYKVMNKVTLNNIFIQNKAAPLEPGDSSSTEELQYRSAVSVVSKKGRSLEENNDVDDDDDGDERTILPTPDPSRMSIHNTLSEDKLEAALNSPSYLNLIGCVSRKSMFDVGL